ncbi:VirB3 family type IV secretion system protein [Escherichia coli]|uniref:VirB3 family type IV secretion system protein n=1 Tax=Escherichia coli TaxID=562 RepID=UPI003EDE9E77
MSKLIWLAIPVAVFVLRMITKQDDHIFNLYFLKLKMLGNSVCHRFIKCRHTIVPALLVNHH